MKALVVTPAHRLELRDISPPKPGPFHALVKILACGICSTTDSELIRGTQPYHDKYPCLLGHEAIGEVVDIGAEVKNFKVGDWVTRPVGILPGTSRDGLTSAWGGFAEYGLVTDGNAMAAAGDYTMNGDYTALRQNVLEGGRSIGLEASVLSIALAETFNWSQKMAMAGKSVCVNGTGIAGLSLALWAKLAGARQVIVLGRRAERLALASELGADEVINIREQSAIDSIRVLNGGVDFFIEATGVPDQMQTAICSVRNGGTVAVYGVAPNGRYEMDWRWMPADIRITQFEPQEHEARAEVVRLISEGKVPVEKLMTHQWPLARFLEAFDTVSAGKVVKSMLLIA
ncbi:MAG: sorbitol dehydrogenase [Sphingobacteriales bacterium]|nr:sorbitol dehydrogenase [Sphingobacteriales bacterium]